MRILVSGAAGYVGSAVVAALVRRGHEVDGLVRSLDGASAAVVRELGARVVEGDIVRPDSLRSAVERADAVIHAAFDATGKTDGGAVDRSFVASVLSVLAETSGLRRFVYTSGAWVLGDTGGEVADETASTEHSAALVAFRPEVERLVGGAGAQNVNGWTIRPGIVYGGSGGITGTMFDSLEREGVVRIVGDGANRWPLVHREDLADVYARIVEQAPADRLFHANDGTHFTLLEIARALALAGGRRGRVSSMPLADARSTMGSFADALALDQRVSNDRAKRVLGWEPAHRSLVEEAAKLWDAYRFARGSTL
jgi:nucleoside-diphosphate-sugar epimerase